MSDIVLPAGAIPGLEAERLRLRAHRTEDLDACTAMWADPVVTRHIGGRPFSREEVWSKILRYAGHCALLSFGYWVAEEKATGGFLGEGGFAEFKREFQPSIEGMPEIGWALVPPAHGKGLATEAVRALCAWGDQHFGKTPTVCMIDPENIASVWVAKKCGYREFHRATALVAELARASRDTTQAQRVLRMLQGALELTRKHTEIMLTPAKAHAPSVTSHAGDGGSCSLVMQSRTWE